MFSPIESSDGSPLSKEQKHQQLCNLFGCPLVFTLIVVNSIFFVTEQITYRLCLSINLIHTHVFSSKQLPYLDSASRFFTKLGQGHKLTISSWPVAITIPSPCRFLPLRRASLSQKGMKP